MYPNTIFLDMSLYDIMIMIGVIAAIWYADRECTKQGFSLALQRGLIIAGFLAIMLGFLSATLFQAFYNWLETGVFRWQGMTFYGGLIFGAGTVLFCWFVLSKPFKVYEEAVAKFKHLADMAACLIPLAHGFGRLGCLFAGCCYGNKTSSWLGIEMHGVKRMPIQLFEAIFLFLLSAALFCLFFKQMKTENKGKYFPLLPVYLIAYGVWRFVIEYARGDERGATIVSFLSPSQLIAVILFAVGIGYFIVWHVQKANKKEKEEKKDENNGSDEGV